MVVRIVICKSLLVVLYVSEILRNNAFRRKQRFAPTAEVDQLGEDSEDGKGSSTQRVGRRRTPCKRTYPRAALAALDDDRRCLQGNIGPVCQRGGEDPAVLPAD